MAEAVGRRECDTYSGWLLLPWNKFHVSPSNCRNSNGLQPQGRAMQCCLSGTGSAPTWFTPNFKLKWSKPNPNPSLFVDAWFKFQFLMFIFPKIRAAALFRGWECPPREQGGEVGGGASPLVPSVLGEFLSGLVSSIPVDAGLG